jgi:hypothetical protein
MSIVKNTPLCQSCGGLGNDCPRCDCSPVPSQLDRAPEQTIEERIVTLMLKTLAAAGWLPVAVFDGEESYETTTLEQVLEYCFCADAGHIYFKHNDWPKSRWVYVINGENWTTITDHTYDPLNDETPPRGDTFRAVMDEVDKLVEAMEESDAS